MGLLALQYHVLPVSTEIIHCYELFVDRKDVFLRSL